MSVRSASIALSTVVAAVIMALLVAQVEWPGSLADCVLAGTCDCETVGIDGIRQPVNALSSLGFFVAGALVLVQATRSHLKLFGAALLTAGIASFVSHAAVRDWSHTLDSLGVKAVVLFLVIYPLTRTRTVIAPYTAGLLLIWAAELSWPATGRPLLILLTTAAIVINLPAQFQERYPRQLQAAVVRAAAERLRADGILVTRFTGRETADRDPPSCWRAQLQETFGRVEVVPNVQRPGATMTPRYLLAWVQPRQPQRSTIAALLDDPLAKRQAP